MGFLRHQGPGSWDLGSSGAEAWGRSTPTPQEHAGGRCRDGLWGRKSWACPPPPVEDCRAEVLSGTATELTFRRLQTHGKLNIYLKINLKNIYLQYSKRECANKEDRASPTDPVCPSQAGLLQDVANTVGVTCKPGGAGGGRGARGLSSHADRPPPPLQVLSGRGRAAAYKASSSAQPRSPNGRGWRDGGWEGRAPHHMPGFERTPSAAAPQRGLGSGKGVFGSPWSGRRRRVYLYTRWAQAGAL